MTRIEVRDNRAHSGRSARDIFLPFYATQKGYGGVALSFTRQVPLAHGVFICALDVEEGGANIRIVI